MSPDAMPPSAVRVRQAARSTSSAEQLLALARDSDVVVRATLAINRNCGEEIEAALSGDSDERVRALLGGRIARLLPDLNAQESTDAARHVHKLLAILASDETVRVRAAIAEEIKAMDAAPRALVMRLANDSAVEVSGPVLRLSPVLTDSDLLALLATPPHPETSESIAGRAGLSPAVSDVIAEHAEGPAIRTLLANRSARRRAAPVDALLVRASNRGDWHVPLIHHPRLSARALAALADLVAAELLGLLSGRSDLEGEALDVVRRRLAGTKQTVDAGNPMVEVLALKAAGELTDALVARTAEHGETQRLSAMLVVAADVPPAMVERAVALRSTKALVSLVWHAGFEARTAALVEAALTHAAPEKLLLPTAAGGYALTDEEMEWQLELLRDPSSDSIALV